MIDQSVRIEPSLPGLPYRGRYGEARPAELAALALPPAPLPGRLGLRPLKRWRYVGIFAPAMMACFGQVRVGPARQAFWAIWDRRERRLRQHTALGTGAVELAPGRVHLRQGEVRVELALQEQAGVECICPAGQGYTWTRKQGGVAATGLVTLDGRQVELDGRAVIDDSAGYHPRHTHWRWSAGVGEGTRGESLAWNLVSGINDPPQNSERTVWVDGAPVEVPPSRFDPSLSCVDELDFRAEAVRARRENLLLLRSAYRQPFGTFSGALPGGIALSHGFGVMEEHDVWW